jgi:hypothetical protein
MSLYPELKRYVESLGVGWLNRVFMMLALRARGITDLRDR